MRACCTRTCSRCSTRRSMPIRRTCTRTRWRRACCCSRATTATARTTSAISSTRATRRIACWPAVRRLRLPTTAPRARCCRRSAAFRRALFPIRRRAAMSTKGNTGPKRARLDVALVERGLVESRSKAQALIMARRVLVNGRIADKAGTAIHEDDELRVAELEHPWVGRGGMKLAHALEKFSIDVTGKVCADIGASTGGFTDVLLRHGAAKVYAIDAGYGQLDASLRNDPRVVVREKVNARFLQPSDFEEPVGFVSVDVSFISLKLILPAVAKFLRGDLVAL